MIFRPKKPAPADSGSQPVLRGRDRVETGQHSSSLKAGNPLARRLHPEDEPDTIDLEKPPRFNTEAGEAQDEPATRDLTREASAESEQERKAPMENFSVITHVPETGKYYVQTGGDGNPVYLEGKIVRTPTELRHGDCIRIGDTELHFLPIKDH